MTDKTNKRSAEISRRSILQVIAWAAGAVPIMLASTGPALASKMSKSSVGYRGSPKGSQKCSNCALFIAPSSCKSVEGPVSPNGWCKIWVKKG
jgi:High potential iron-sulfur protein